MRVQDAEAPGAQDEEAERRCQDPDERHRELELDRSDREPGGQQAREGRGEQHPGEHERPRHQDQERRHRPSKTPCLLLTTVAQHPGVGRHEGPRQDTVTEQVLQQVRDAERRPERLRREPRPEVVGEQLLAQQPCETRQQDARPDGGGGAREALAWAARPAPLHRHPDSS